MQFTISTAAHVAFGPYAMLMYTSYSQEKFSNTPKYIFAYIYLLLSVHISVRFGVRSLANRVIY